MSVGAAAFKMRPIPKKKEPSVSIDKSLRRKNQLQRSRNVLTRGERINQLKSEERWPDGRSPFGLPKVRVLKIAKKAKKAAKEEEATAEGAAPAAGAAGATPAAAAAAPAGKGAAKK